MKAPLSWLKEFVDIDITVEELEKKLFSCGLEVEETIYYGKNIDKIVVARILKTEKHPNADKLTVCQIDAGKYGNLQIITAATNIFEGALVPVALDGATLFNGERIYNGQLRGLPSYGMFCSGEELGITDDFYPGASVYGILILNEDYPLGAEVKDVLGIEDVIFDINVTANRPDCQSILGLAREVAAVLNKPIKGPSLEYVATKGVSTKATIKVSDKAPDLCPRYMAHYIKNLKIGESPLWMKKRLFRMGLRSISNIVDVTNYVLLEIGQPMHAFDLNDLEGNEIVIRRAENGEKIITLDEKEFALSENNLVICDSVKPVALAGVMGGLNSEIKSTTKDVVFECAKFARDNVRKTARLLGQRTDASSRYEKGIDANSAEVGLKRALHLVDELKMGEIAEDNYDLLFEKIENKVISTKISKINAVLGITVPTDVIVNSLEKLNFEVKVSGDDIVVKAPLYRDDIEDYPDLAEEVIREYGYEHIEPTLLKTSSITAGGLNKEQTDIANLKTLLTGYGFNEILTYSFVSEKEYDIFGFDKNSDEYRFIKILNPIGEDLSVMRTSLLPSICRIIASNLKRKNMEGRLFEFAKIYQPKSLPLTELPIENEVLSLGVFGENEDFFTLKGVIEDLISNFAYGAEVKFVRSNKSCMHPTRSADVVINGKVVGYFGELLPQIADKLDIDKKIYVGEIKYYLLKEFFNNKIVFKPISKFPPVERDLAITVGDNISWGDIYSVIKESAGDKLDSVKLFDIYKGDQIEKGKKSVAFNLTFVSLEATLTVEEIDQAINNILECLKSKLGAELR
ncbi:MAG: phenylalanine--tRNA ligase subunit beta [Clostridia bacterium]|nr:phenylalanine--tRNA ligase subunit beta [Clostridia bacterium]